MYTHIHIPTCSYVCAYVYVCIYIDADTTSLFPYGQIYIYMGIQSLHVCRCLHETGVVTFLRPPAMAHWTIDT